MKPLDNEQQEAVFKDIIKSIAYINQPAPGEFTLEMLYDALKEQGYDVTKNKLRHRVRKLLDGEIVGKREITTNGAKTNVYFPLREVSYEEIVEVLLDS